MPLPAPLSRRKSNVHKNTFGHILILAGSPRMLGAAALSTLAAFRGGAGLVTLGLPKSLNLIAQKKIAHPVMTLPLAETRDHNISYKSYRSLKTHLDTYTAIAIGPGLGKAPGTQKFIRAVITGSSAPLVIDADGLNALENHTEILLETNAPKILTPHPGEMTRLTGYTKKQILDRRQAIAVRFAREHKCTLLLKGPKTIVASANGKIYINKTGNTGLATAGSGDVLTGLITAFAGQGLPPFQAAAWGAYIHGMAADKAIRWKTKLSLIATDLLERIPDAVRSADRRKSPI